MRRLELLLLSEPDPKSGAATNYATPARKLRGKNTIFLRMEVPNNLKKKRTFARQDSVIFSPKNQTDGHISL